MTMTVIPHKTPCLRCVFAEMPPAGSAQTCDTAGVVQPIISIIAAVQVAEAFKILTGNFEKLHNSLMQFDVWENDWRKIKLGAPDENCQTCGKGEFAVLNAENADFEAVLCGRDAVQIAARNKTQLDLPDLAKRLAVVGAVKQNEYLVRFNTGEFEITVFRDARAIVRGTDDITVARSLYAKFVGN